MTVTGPLQASGKKQLDERMSERRPHESTAKSIFNLEFAKIVLNLKLQQLLGESFTSLTLSLDQTEVLARIVVNRNVFESEKSRSEIKKDELTLMCKEVLSWYSKFPVKVVILQTSKDLMDHPKYYYRLLVKRSLNGKVNLLNALSKIEKITLSPNIQGLLIRVKGKRGNRKDKKTILLGNPCRHSNKKDKLIKGLYTIDTRTGSYGIKIYLVMR